MSSGRKIEREESAMEKMGRVHGEVLYHLYDLETMIKLGETAAIEEDENTNFKLDWAVVFSILGKLHKDVEGKLNELEELIAQGKNRTEEPSLSAVS